MRLLISRFAILLALPFLVSSFLYAKEEKPNSVISGKEVKINYTLTVDGKVIDSTAGREPLSYTQGKGMMISGLEKKLEGLKVGDKIQADIVPEEAYGPVNPSAMVEVALDKLPKEGLQVGAVLTTTNDAGQPINAVVSEIKEKTAIMNFNHPLAGKQLHFDVEIVAIS